MAARGVVETLDVVEQSARASRLASWKTAFLRKEGLTTVERKQLVRLSWQLHQNQMEHDLLEKNLVLKSVRGKNNFVTVLIIKDGVRLHEIPSFRRTAARC